MDYDNDVLGVGNYEHPSNKGQKDEFEFDSNNIQKCLEHYKETGDIEYLENAIYRNELIHKNAHEELTKVIKLLRNKAFDDSANFLCKLRDTFK